MDAFTIGCYINGGRYYIDNEGEHGIKADPYNSLFQHEYGHYLQSREHGLFYVFDAVKSMYSAWTKRDHIHSDIEMDANRRAFFYFSRYIIDFSYYNNKGFFTSYHWKWHDNPLNEDDEHYYIR